MGGFDAISRADFSAMVSKKLLAVYLTSSEKKILHLNNAMVNKWFF
jgi:hypothetical protein